MPNNVNFAINASPGALVPKKVNLFLIQTINGDVYLDCMFNTKQVDKNGNCPVFCADRLAVDPADLKSLSDSIVEHLTKTGYLEIVQKVEPEEKESEEE